MLTYEWDKPHHEANKEPNPGSSLSHAAISEAFASEQTVGDCIDHEEGDGGEDSAQVEHVPGVLVVADGGVQSKPPAREEEKAGEDGGNFVPLLAPVNVVDEVR